MRITRVLVMCAIVATTACMRAVRTLPGTPVPPVIPSGAMPTRPMQLAFTWSYADEGFRANGDGAVRVQPPDRARLDFFLRNGSAGGYAILDGDSLFVPGPDVTRRVVPPAPLLWAALGRAVLPSAPDTVARREGDTLRIDLGKFVGDDASKAEGTAWRLSFAGARLARLERIENGKRVEWLTRERGTDGETVRYTHETGRRRLTIVLGDTTWVEGFDDFIWRRQ